MGRVLIFLTVFAVGMLVYFVGGYWAGISVPVRTAFKLGIPFCLLFVTLLVKRKAAFAKWYPVWLGFLAASVGFLVAWTLNDPLLKLTGLATDSIPGIASAKFLEALLIVTSGLLVARSGGMTFKDMYLCRGRLKTGLVIGVSVFAAFLLIFILQAREQGLVTATLVSLAPWTLLFVFSNAFMEEFHFRGLLLKPVEKLIGRHGSNLCVALFFTVVHAPVQYTPDIFVFLGVLFVLALLWGYVMQKTRAIWASVLFHAGADLLIILGIYRTYGGL